jgi:hypothetical protein
MTAPSSHNPAEKTPAQRYGLVVLLLASGVACWATLGGAKTGGTAALVALAISVLPGAAAAVLLLRPARETTRRAVERLGDPSPRRGRSRRRSSAPARSPTCS